MAKRDSFSRWRILPERQGISVQPAASSTWILLRDASNTFLLVEYHPEAAQWKTFLVPDPKKAVDELKSILGNWTDILPILKIAYEKAHPLEKKPDLKYVENLLTEAYHHLHPNEFLSQRIHRGQGRLPKLVLVCWSLAVVQYLALVNSRVTSKAACEWPRETVLEIHLVFEEVRLVSPYYGDHWHRGGVSGIFLESDSTSSGNHIFHST